MVRRERITQADVVATINKTDSAKHTMFKSLFGSGEQQEPPNLLERLKLGIQKTRAGLVEAFTGKKEINADLLDELEYALITADVGVRTTTEILDSVRETIRMARIEAGRLQLNKQPHFASDLVAAALESVKPLMEDRPVQISVPASLPAVVVDFELIALTLRQLLTNALKYSHPDSPIAVSASLDDGRVTVRVRDRGQGIPDRERSRIFEKFYRVPDRADRVPGTGMGLHIAREIIKAHGGEIGVNSVVGEGSEFFFTLPAGKS
jgi:signal transduction histidine kinase